MFSNWLGLHSEEAALIIFFKIIPDELLQRNKGCKKNARKWRYNIFSIIFSLFLSKDFPPINVELKHSYVAVSMGQGWCQQLLLASLMPPEMLCNEPVELAKEAGTEEV